MQHVDGHAQASPSAESAEPHGEDVTSRPVEQEEIHLLSARLNSAFIACCVAFVCLYLGMFLTVKVLRQGHTPGPAGGPVAALFIGSLMLGGAYAMWLALRAMRSGVSIDASGITIRGGRRDRRVSWSDIAQFESASGAEAYGYRWVAARVNLRDGSSLLIEGTRVSVGMSRRKHSEKVERCVQHLNGVLEGRVAQRSCGSLTAPALAAGAEGAGTTGPMSPSGASSRSTITGA